LFSCCHSRRESAVPLMLLLSLETSYAKSWRSPKATASRTPHAEFARANIITIRWYNFAEDSIAAFAYG
jgi:hypothetical protein